MYRLSGIYIYPVKSLGGISLQKSLVQKRGLQFDRRWMLINSQDYFMTQRHYPQMAQLKTEVTDSGIKIVDKKNESDYCIVPFEPKDGNEIEVPIWDDHVTAIKVDKNIDIWLSEKIGEKCKVVFMPEKTKRQVQTEYASEGDIVGFADAFPFLMIGESSLTDLNTRMNTPVPMNRFRPNFVFTGGVPYEEDVWNDFEISGLRFKAVKPCRRCVIITTDQETTTRDSEPLTVLAQYRKIGSNVMFGQNVIGYDEGMLNVGDTIILRSKAPNN